MSVNNNEAGVKTCLDYIRGCCHQELSYMKMLQKDGHLNGIMGVVPEIEQHVSNMAMEIVKLKQKIWNYQQDAKQAKSTDDLRSGIIAARMAVSEIMEDAADEAMDGSIRNLGHNLNAKLIALEQKRCNP